MKRLVKGSKEAKAFMAKIRAKKGKTKKVVAKKLTVKKVGAIAKTKSGKIAKRLNKAQSEYNKDVKAYKYFVFADNKVQAGFEFKSDALDMANDFSNAKIYNKTQLKQKGIKNPINDWLYTIGSNYKKTAIKKVGSTLKLDKKEMRLGMRPKTTSRNNNKYHKDTKSHNVRISVVSGAPRLSKIEKQENVLERIKSLVKYNNDIEQQLLNWKDRLKTDKSEAFIKLQKNNVQQEIKKYTILLKSNKKYLSELKKVI